LLIQRMFSMSSLCYCPVARSKAVAHYRIEAKRKEPIGIERSNAQYPF
jgi:hypothetical protein